MADSDPLSQMFNLFAAPLAGAVQSVDQFRKGVEQFQRGVENFNRTMENLNETSERINVLLAEVEEPLRAAVPQVTRTVKAADDMMKIVSGPAIAVAPGLQMLAETLNTPAMRQMPDQLAQMNEVLSEVTTRLAPLGQLADTAGGLFGGLKLPGFGGSPRPAATRATSDPVAEREEAAAAAAAAKDRAEKVAPARKTAAKKSPAKKKPAARKKAASRKKTASSD
ncbi:hypothetical protein [Ilumatobacter sp.]|uniref:hypothetical protein n=1 Tax=Ilumatobacter sp. TaxID=1967498 RepID=UPI003C4840C0